MGILLRYAKNVELTINRGSMENNAFFNVVAQNMPQMIIFADIVFVVTQSIIVINFQINVIA